MKTIFKKLNATSKLLLLLFLFVGWMIQKSVVPQVPAYAEFSDSARALEYPFCMEFFISGIDIVNAAQIEIKIGYHENDTSAVNQVIDFDITNGLPAGFSYSRLKNKISIGVGFMQAIWTYCCSVRIKDHAGSWSMPYKFITN